MPTPINSSVKQRHACKSAADAVQPEHAAPLPPGSCRATPATLSGDTQVLHTTALLQKRVGQNTLSAEAPEHHSLSKQDGSTGRYLTSTILMTDALPMRCSATMESPTALYCIFFARSIAACVPARTPCVSQPRLRHGPRRTMRACQHQVSHAGGQHAKRPRARKGQHARAGPRLHACRASSRVHAQGAAHALAAGAGASAGHLCRESGREAGAGARARTSRISSVVSESDARALPDASSGSRPRVMRHCRAGCSPLHVQVSESVVSTGTATVSTGMAGRYLATSRAVEPPRVSTTISDACTCGARVPSHKVASGSPAALHRASEDLESRSNMGQPGRRARMCWPDQQRWGRGSRAPCAPCARQTRRATPAATWARPRAS